MSEMTTPAERDRPKLDWDKVGQVYGEVDSRETTWFMMAMDKCGVWWCATADFINDRCIKVYDVKTLDQEVGI